MHPSTSNSLPIVNNPNHLKLDCYWNLWYHHYCISSPSHPHTCRPISCMPRDVVLLQCIIPSFLTSTGKLCTGVSCGKTWTTANAGGLVAQISICINSHYFSFLINQGKTFKDYRWCTKDRTGVCPYSKLSSISYHKRLLWSKAS